MEEKKSEGVESGCVSQAEGAKTDAPSLGPVTLGEKKRIIRKVSVLDPSRLSKLGLDKIIIQAVSKLKGLLWINCLWMCFGSEEIVL